MTSADIHYRACNLCEAICGIEIKLEPDQTLDLALEVPPTALQ